MNVLPVQLALTWIYKKHFFSLNLNAIYLMWRTFLLLAWCRPKKKNSQQFFFIGAWQQKLKFICICAAQSNLLLYGFQIVLWGVKFLIFNDILMTASSGENLKFPSYLNREQRAAECRFKITKYQSLALGLEKL